MIAWLSDPSRASDIAAWGFILTVASVPLTFIGLLLTYLQARRARFSADKVKSSIDLFSFKKDQSEALPIVGEAKAAMEGAALLIRASNWRDASSRYDEARKAIQRLRILCIYLSPDHQRSLRLICDHLSSFSNSVDAASAGKGKFPEQAKVASAIRRNTDTLTSIQRVIQEALQ